MGRVVTTITRVLAEEHPDLPYRVIDTWGPKPGRKSLSPIYFALAVAAVLWEAARRRAGLLHIHMASRGSIVRKGILVLIGRVLGIPVVLHLHGNRFDKFYNERSRGVRAAIRLILLGATRIVVLGGHWQEFVRNEVRVADARVVVLPNTVSAPDQTPERNGETPHLVFLGRVERHKGMGELLTALASDKVMALDWQATIAGEGELQEYISEAERLSIASRVKFCGWLEEDETHGLLASADIFVLPSHYENHPMSLLEAMAFGAAVIATSVGAVPETVQDGVSGLIIPPGDARALAQGIVRLVENKELRLRLQSGARRAFEERAGLSEYGRRIRTLYEDCGVTAAARP